MRPFPQLFNYDELELLTKISIIRIGQSEAKMVQYIFTDKADADKLAAWLKKQDRLKQLNIDKARADLSFDKTQYVVRLTGEQYKALYGEGAYELLLNPLLVEQQLLKELCQLVKNKQEDQFLERIKKTSPEVINKVLALSNDEGGLLQITARYLSEFVFTALLNELSNDGVKQSLSHKGPAGWTLLQTTARYQSERAFISLLGKTDRDTISQDIKLQNEDGATSLQLAARHQSEEAFLSLLIKSNLDDLTDALLMKNKQQESALQTINHYQNEHLYNTLSSRCPQIKTFSSVLELLCNLAKDKNDSTFLSALESINPDYIDTYLTLKNKDGNFLLQIAARYLQKNTFDKLLEKATPELISQALFFQNKYKETALQTAIRYQDSATVLTLLSKINQDALNQAVLYPVHAGWTILQSAARHLNEAAFIALLNKISPDVLNKALLLQNADEWAVLRLAMLHQNSAVVLVLLDKVSLETLNKVTLFQGCQKSTLLQIAALRLDEASFIALLTKIDPITLQQTLPARDSKGDTVLQIAARHQHKSAFDALLAVYPEVEKNKTMPDAIQLANTLANLTNDKLNFEEKLSTLTDNELSLALMTDVGTTILLRVLAFLDNSSFNNFLKRANPNAINAALSMKSSYNETALKVACRYLNTKDFIALLDKTTPTEVSKALPLKDNADWNALMTAARNQSEMGCMALLNKLPGTIPAAALTKDAVVTVCTQQSVKVVALLLKKIDNGDLADLFSQVPPLETLLVAMLTIFNDTDWNDPISCSITENILGAAKVRYAAEITELIFTQYYIKGYPLPEAERAIAFLSTMIEEQPVTKKTTALLFSLGTKKISDLNLNSTERLSFLSTDKPYIYLSNETCYILDEIIEKKVFDDFVKNVIKYGLATWQDFMKLSKALPALLSRDNYAAEDLFHFLIKNELKGTATLYGPLPLKSDAGSVAIQAFSTGQAVVKIISSDKNLKEHTAALKDPAHFRIPKLRKENAADSTHKFFHKTGVILSYQKKAPANGQWTATQKTSVTHISRHLHTKLFGSHYSNSTLVGFAYKAQPALDKAWLSRDRGTYEHEWIGSQFNVQTYADRISNVNHIDYASFLSTIDDHSNTTNEVLTHLTKERLLAVIIGRDTPNDRKLARKYADYIKTELNIELPIIFYDSTHRTVIEYNIRAQREDKLKTIYPNFSFVEEENAKLRLFNWLEKKGLSANSNQFFIGAQQTEISGYNSAPTLTWVDAEKKIMTL